MQSAIDFILENQLVDKRDSILVGISGGRDSVALASFLHQAGYKIALAHVNYHLRKEASDLDMKLVEEFSKKLNVPLYLEEAELIDHQNTQVWAREVRYAFFNRICSEQNFDKIALAHHKNDNIETFFLNLLRGTGMKGLEGMPVKRQNIIRPLLNTTRLEIDDYISKNNLDYREDESNIELKYTRNQIRHKLMPLLKEVGEDSFNKLDASMKMIQDDNECLDHLANSYLKQSENVYEIDASNLDPAISRTIVYHALKQFGFNRSQCRDLAIAKSGAMVTSIDYSATKSKGRIVVMSNQSKMPSIEVLGTGVYEQGKRKIEVSKIPFEQSMLPKGANRVWTDASRVHFPLRWRLVNDKDDFRPIGSDYLVSVKKYLKDAGVDRLNRSSFYVLSDIQNNIIWLPGLMLSDDFKCTNKTEAVICFQLF